MSTDLPAYSDGIVDNISPFNTSIYDEKGTNNTHATVNRLDVSIYLTIGVIGIAGNCFTLIVLCSSVTIRNKTVNIFIISQSALDFICSVILIATAWDVVWAMEKRDFGLKVFHKTSFRKRHAFIMILFAWIFGPAFTLARIIPTTDLTPDGICIQNLIYPSQMWFTISSVIVCIVHFFFPLLLILSLYLSIFLYLRRKAGGIGEGPGNQSEKLNAAKWNVLKTLVFLTVLFFLCWVWNISIFLLVTLGVQLNLNSPFYNFSVFMTNVNCCVNPFCYALQYRDFQTQAKNLCWKRKPASSMESVSSEVTTTSGV